MKINTVLIYFLIPIVFFIIFCIIYLNSIRKIPIRYLDEHDWIARSYFLTLFVKHDYKNPLYKTYDGIIEPKLASYYYGLIIYPDYLKERYSIRLKNYDFAVYLLENNFYMKNDVFEKKYYQYIKKSIDWNLYPKYLTTSPSYLKSKFGTNIIRTINLIYKARTVNAFILAINVIIIYFLSYLISKKPLISLLTAFFYGTNKLIVEFSLFAHSEGLFLLFFNISILTFFCIKNSRYRNYILIFLFSILAALATATKLNGLILIIIFDVFYLFNLITLFMRNRKITTEFIILLGVNIIFFLLFLIHDPYFYSSPIKKMIEMFQARQNEAIRQAEVIGPALHNFQDRLVSIYTNFFGKQSGSLYNINSFSILYPKGNFNLFNLSFFILGLAFVLKKILPHKKSNYLFFLIWFIFIQLIMGFYLYLKWERYYIQLVFFFLFIETVGIFFLFNLLNKCVSWLISFLMIRD